MDPSNLDKLNKGRDPYTVLGILSTASADEIKKVYRKLALKYHPDQCKLDKDTCVKIFQEINWANQFLEDEGKKQYLNARLLQQAPPRAQPRAQPMAPPQQPPPQQPPPQQAPPRAQPPPTSQPTGVSRPPPFPTAASGPPPSSGVPNQQPYPTAASWPPYQPAGVSQPPPFPKVPSWRDKIPPSFVSSAEAGVKIAANAAARIEEKKRAYNKLVGIGGSRTRRRRRKGRGKKNKSKNKTLKR